MNYVRWALGMPVVLLYRLNKIRRDLYTRNTIKVQPTTYLCSPGVLKERYRALQQTLREIRQGSITLLEQKGRVVSVLWGPRLRESWLEGQVRNVRRWS